jgi:hypothetical protein
VPLAHAYALSGCMYKQNRLERRQPLTLEKEKETRGVNLATY